MYSPSFQTFEKLAREGNLIPVYREILADTETPVSVLMKLRSRTHAFLLESVEGGEKWGRYTFLGSDPRVIFRVRGKDVVIQENGETKRQEHGGDPMRFLRDLMARYRPVHVEGLPRFYGGAVGFLGYDMVRYFERLPAGAADDLYTDDAVFLITDTLIIFDNVRHTIKIVACAFTEGRKDLRALYEETTKKIEEMVGMVQAPLLEKGRPPKTAGCVSLQSNMTPE